MNLFAFKVKKFLNKENNQVFIEEFFYFLTIILFSFFILDLLFSGILSALFNFNIIFIFWLINLFLLLRNFKEKNI